MIKEDIKKAMYQALKEKKVTDLKVLRFVLSQIQYEEINKQKEITDEETISLLRKEVKKRREAIELFKKGNRQDLVTDEENQIAVIGQYLPQQLSDKDIEKAVDEVLKTSDKSMANMGKIIGAVMQKVKGQADGSVVASIVRKKLQ